MVLFGFSLLHYYKNKDFRFFNKEYKYSLLASVFVQ